MTASPSYVIALHRSFFSAVHELRHTNPRTQWKDGDSLLSTDVITLEKAFFFLFHELTHITPRDRIYHAYLNSVVSYFRRVDSFMCVTWLSHVCDMTHSCVWQDSFMCVTWLIHVWDMTHAYVSLDLVICVTRHIHFMSRQSFICVTWLIHMWDMTH